MRHIFGMAAAAVLMGGALAELAPRTQFDGRERLVVARSTDLTLAATLHLPQVARRYESYREMSMQDMLSFLTSMPDRRPGSENGRRTESFLANAFRALGCDITRQDVPVNDWRCDATQLTVGGRSIPCGPVPYSPFPGTVTGRLVYVPEEADLQNLNVRGAVLLTEQRCPLLPLGELYDLRLAGTTLAPPVDDEPAWWLSAPGITPAEAEAAGAVALLQILVDHPGSNPSRYWPYEGPSRGVPAVYVGASEGDALREAAARGASATLTLEGSIERRFSQNIIAELEGSSSRVYLFETHHDSPYAGAVDDASSLVALVELARRYADLPRQQRPGRMVFACTTGHFDGAIGARLLARDILPQWRRRYRAAFSLEQIGARAVVQRDGRLVATDELVRQDVFVPGNDRVLAAVTAAYEAARIPNVLILPASSSIFPLPPGEGGTLCMAGLPTVQLVSAPPYLLTAEDSPDKVDLEHVARQVELLMDIVSRMG